MKRISTFVLAGMSVACIGAALVADAPPTAPAPATKVTAGDAVRYYDVERVFTDSKQLRARFEELRKEFEQKGKEFQQKAESLKKSMEDLQKKQSVMSPEALASEREKLENEYQDLGVQSQREEKRFQQKELKLRQDFAGELMSMVEQFCNDRKIDVLQPVGPGMYVKKHLDVTNELLGYINQQYEKSKKK